MHPQHVWHDLVVWYLFLAGTGAGIYLITLGNKLLRKDNSLQNIGYFWGPAFVAVGTGFLLLDLGRPLFAPLAVLKPFSSMISIGTIILSLFLVLGLVQMIQNLYRKRETPRYFDWIGFCLAIGTATYTGLLLGVVKAIPFWNSPILLPLLFLASALSSGVGFILFSLVVAKKVRSEQISQALHSILKLDVGLILTEIVVLGLILYISNQSGGAAASSVAILLEGFLALPFWGLVIGVGLLLPLLLETLVRSQKESVLLICALSLLVGGIALRYSIVFAGVFVPFS
ncbi:formate-dependent nitrite reductase, membrane component [Desulfitobacterium dichloroeliminans LMG P-21439]|uniref:Formate-dependent nitrite reductase, membrane component n=1 Tax=Desulfitobacterium dichloroeliminans (strain LMG P-21439 / DCA1) TaxID=871963 RepID=L0F3I1_DESDL|nr:NrfD/PsrC family molybdoenzyme membrane anchor subunit [Desulfitobacterium dichloroeliminans]AGA68399.1 formate-dependent nitrite reductase, membrane component [Desulfitobacterium dichloroeliminans LMG P-21439]